MQTYDIREIMTYLPHRYPFLLIDRILDLDPGKSVLALKNVSMNEPFFQGHFPGHPVMPGVLIVEAMAQVGGFLLMGTVDNPDQKVVYFMSLDNVKFRRPVVPGDQIMLATSTGQSIRVPIDQISFRSRSAGGVRVFNTGKGEVVVSVARVAETEDEDEVDGDDELYDAVKAVVIETGRASTSYIQRMFRIGYSRAAALLDKLEMNGVIGPQIGSKPREVLVDKE